MRGIVAWFNNVKSFGFITPHGGGQDHFVHFTAIQGEGFRSLEKGQRVEYELGTDEGTGRTVAKNVVPLPMRPKDKEK